MTISTSLARPLLGALLVLLPASGCVVDALGSESLTVRVTVLDVHTDAPVEDARVGVGYERIAAPTRWVETTHTDASGEITFELASCEQDRIAVNVFSAPVPGGGLYGPSIQRLDCAPGTQTVTMRIAPY